MAEQHPPAAVEDRTFRLAFEAIPTAACIVQRLSAPGAAAQGWQFVAVNSAMQGLLGPGEAAGRTMGAHGGDAQRQLAALLDRACASGEPVSAEQAFGRDSTASRIEIAPLPGADGRLSLIHI